MSPPSINSWLAFDIGGANIKAADGRGWFHSEPFAMWQDWKRLPEVIVHIKSLHPATHYAVTMTGEIADCFSDRREGVKHIVGSCSLAAGENEVVFYSVDGTLLGADKAIHQPLQVAASNWHALARFAGSLAPSRRSWLIDIGSTTTDIVPLAYGQPIPQGMTDWDRLLCGELSTGIERTPIPALVRSLPHRGITRPVASECFATSGPGFSSAACATVTRLSQPTKSRPLVMQLVFVWLVLCFLNQRHLPLQMRLKQQRQLPTRRLCSFKMP